MKLHELKSLQENTDWEKYGISSEFDCPRGYGDLREFAQAACDEYTRPDDQDYEIEFEVCSKVRIFEYYLPEPDDLLPEMEERYFDGEVDYDGEFVMDNALGREKFLEAYKEFIKANHWLWQLEERVSKGTATVGELREFLKEQK